MQDTKDTLVPSPALPGVPIVTVEVLDRLAADLDQDSIALNTRKSYVSDWASWIYFCEGHRIKPIPADPADVRRYLTQLGAVGGRKGVKLRPRIDAAAFGRNRSRAPRRPVSNSTHSTRS